jgi:heme/copper-type cytochrome/quinol oxidase subunit 3
MMNQVGAIDVSHLPQTSFGHREPLWWGIVLGIVIETSGFALVWATVLYLRMQEGTWPPWRWSAPDLTAGLVSTAVILASAIPMRITVKAAKAFDEAKVRFWLVVFFVVALIACAIRVWEFFVVQVKWDSNAYGSVVWAMLTLHTVHILTSVFDIGLATAYVFLLSLDDHRALDLEVNGLYWYFVVASWIPTFTLLYLGPHFLN